MCTFNDLAIIDDESLSRLVKQIPRETLVTALASASDEIKNRVFGVVSERAVELICEDLDLLPENSDSQHAQEKIVLIMKEMGDQGNP